MSYVSTTEGIPRVSRIFTLPLIVIFAGILACTTHATDTPAASPAGPSTIVTFATASRTGDSASTSLPKSPPSELVPTPGEVSTPLLASSPQFFATQEYTGNPIPKLRSTTASAPAPTRTVILMNQPSIGTEVGKKLPQFEIKLFDGTKKSTTRISSLGRPVFLFFFTTW